MPNWTPQQKNAIEARNHTILVSAAAGSGKTAVLVERIVRLVNEGVELNRMLIITFTKAAAAEMRQRLAKRLSMENSSEIITRAIEQLETAQISTIHAFCQRVIKNHFEQIGIDPLVRVCDDQQRTSMFEAAFQTAIDELLDEKQQDILMLADAWEQKELLSLCAELYAFLMAIPKPFQWLSEKIDAYDESIKEQPWFHVLEKTAIMELSALPDDIEMLHRLMELPDAVPERREAIRLDEQEIQSLLTVQEDLATLAAMLRTFKLPTLKRVTKQTEAQKEWGKQFSDVRTQMKKRIEKISNILNNDHEQTKQEIPAIQQQLRGMSCLIRRVHAHFLAEKGKRNVMDFGDMEQFTMEILENPDVCAQMQGEFDQIFVDECQDVSQVQDAIIQAIHGEHNSLFMVGDVKQSIYRFRKADPTLFLHRMRTFSDEENASERRIILQQNFRSAYNVLDATNRVFRQTMKPEVTELTYGPEDELICGLDVKEKEPPVTVHLIDESSVPKKTEKQESKPAIRMQARAAAVRIQALVNDQDKQIRYKDIVILLSQTANIAPIIVEELTNAGIPTFYDGEESFFELPEIRDMKTFLSLLDNEKQDLPLIAVLKMVPFKFTDQELADIRLTLKGRKLPFYEAFAKKCEEDDALAKKCRDTKAQLDTLRFEADVMMLSDFIWHLMTSSGYYASVGALPKGELRQANLRMLFERAKTYEDEGGETLTGFISRMDEQQRGGDSISAKMLGENENLVRVMTMHKSKGLEFPVVFLMNLSQAMVRVQRSAMQLHTQLGVVLPYVNRKMNIRRKTCISDAFEAQRQMEELAERARLLYVAMTRAKTDLELFAVVDEKDRDKWMMPESNHRILSSGSMINWVMQAICTEEHKQSTSYPQDATPWNCEDCDDFRGKPVENIRQNSTSLDEIVRVLNGEMQTAPFEKEEPRKPYEPLKTSVSALAKKKREQNAPPLIDVDEDAPMKREADEQGTPLVLSELPRRPAFMEEHQMTAAERGTLTHRALSLLPLERVRTCDDIAAVVREELQRMCQQGIMSETELRQIRQSAITGYFTSPLGQRMLQSEKVRREWAFNYRLDGEDTQLLQGVIDCVFEEEGAWILLDYKTDFIEDPASFVERYTMQLNWYARALQGITKRPVREMWLYSLSRNQAYRVPEKETT